jgi:uncharacterized protein HemY
MFEAAEAFDVRYLERFARLGKRFLADLRPSNSIPKPEQIDLARIKIEQAMREIVDGQEKFAETFLKAAYKDEPGKVVWGLGMTVWASAGPMLEDELRRQGKAILAQAAKKRPRHRLLLRAHAVMARSERNYPAALKYLDMLLKVSPKDVEAVNDKVEVFMLQEDYHHAHKLLRKALRVWPGHEMLVETFEQFKRDSKECPRCGAFMRAAAPFCPGCKHSFL